MDGELHPAAARLLGLLRRLWDAAPAPLRRLPPVARVAEQALQPRFFIDPLYRTAVLLPPSLLLHLLYAVLHLMLGTWYRSVWSAAMAVYHGLLALMRLRLLRVAQVQPEGPPTEAELKSCRRCGLTLLAMTPVFASFVMLVVHKGSGARYPAFAIALMLVYTVGVMGAAAVRLRRLRRDRRPALSALRSLSLVAALMSALSAITALAVRLEGTDRALLRQALIGTASGAVCVITLGLAIALAVRPAGKRSDRKKQKWTEETTAK